ncbi:MAG: hypothetical protein KDK30_04520 [Leptospiraceae bacterium]|nr:hypothetical protein [Leptospiraceae bacterium]MCB1314561.1 hypothetical protein [Leptospiraceae bacterium]
MSRNFEKIGDQYLITIEYDRYLHGAAMAEIHNEFGYKRFLKIQTSIPKFLLEELVDFGSLSPANGGYQIPQSHGPYIISRIRRILQFPGPDAQSNELMIRQVEYQKDRFRTIQNTNPEWLLRIKARNLARRRKKRVPKIRVRG